MRLWHVDLIPQLPRQQLLGQHRECAALRGKGWGRPHATVNYVFEHPYLWLYFYHVQVMAEMDRRGYNVNMLWFNRCYRGKRLGYDHSGFCVNGQKPQNYPEHDDDYMQECLDNLREKGVVIDTPPRLVN